MSAISIKKYGSGKKTLVLFPGWTHPAEKEPRFLDLLSKKYQVISIHLPGYVDNVDQKKFSSFNSLANEISDLLKEAKTKEPVLVGFSLGCWLIMEFDKVHPTTYQKIFVGCPIEPFSIPIWAKPLVSSHFIINLLRQNTYFMQFAVNMALRAITNGQTLVFKPNTVSLRGAFDSLVGLLSSNVNVLQYLEGTAFIYGENDSFYEHAKLKKPNSIKVIALANHNCVTNNEKEVVGLIDASLK